MVEIEQITDVKNVKASIFVRADNEYICKHYGTEILKVVPITDEEKKTLPNMNAQSIDPRLKIVTLNRYSVTSSKMINRCLEYLGHSKPQKAKELEIF